MADSLQWEKFCFSCSHKRQRQWKDPDFNGLWVSLFTSGGLSTAEPWDVSGCLHPPQWLHLDFSGFLPCCYRWLFLLISFTYLILLLPSPWSESCSLVKDEIKILRSQQNGFYPATVVALSNSCKSTLTTSYSWHCSFLEQIWATAVYF